MIITNSLGSNYCGEDIRLSLALLLQPWKWQNGDSLEKFRKLLGNGFNVRLFYKGRQAIGEALRILRIGAGDEVVVQAFTCVAVVQPILEAGARPVYADVASRRLNPPLSSIKAAINSKTKAVILQHTLGYVNPENEKIISWCREKGITVIQDLAHALGASALEKAWPCVARPGLNKNPDAIVLSFSQDKVVDGISGGGLIILNQPTVATSRLNDLNHLTLVEIWKMLLYPICTWLVRSTYQFGIGGFSIGKAIHWLAKLIGLLNSPIEASTKPFAMPNALAALAVFQLGRLEKIARHRQEIALVYDEIIINKLKVVSREQILLGSNLRYPIWVSNQDELEEKLKKHGFYLVDHWYDAPVSPKWINPADVRYLPGSCPNAEELSKHIFNLPTHVNISESKGKNLALLINQHAKSR